MAPGEPACVQWAKDPLGSISRTGVNCLLITNRSQAAGRSFATPMHAPCHWPLAISTRTERLTWCGYQAAGKGLLTIHRGNPDAIFANAPEAKRRKADGTFTEAAFLSPGSTQTFSSVSVSNGSFTVTLDLAPTPFP